MNPEGNAAPLLFAQREMRLAALDALPRSLWLGSLINSRGTLEPRLGALRELHEALLAGGLPDPASARWPDGSLASALHVVFVNLDLPGMCRDHAALADQVVSTMLWHLDRIVDYVDRGDNPDAAAARAVAAFAEEWHERRGMVDELVAVFGTLGELAENTNWDLLHGLLTSAGWQEIVRIRGLLETLPELSRLLRRLGRAEPADDADESNQVELERREQSSAPCPRVRLMHIPELPGATRGVYRSGRVARMLPSETMLLTHPRLRLVWHARHAERCLLTYEDDERMPVLVRERMPVAWPTPQRRPNRRMEAGPMLVCVDTSGSMQGGAEAVAKAVVLEAVRVAHAQKRACLVFAFGGPDEILELELRLDATGLARMIEFLGQGFRGGTDICGPLERVLTRLTEERWKLADLLIASDGEFGATPATAAATVQAKTELGLRVQGVLVGDRETIGLLELADDVFWVRDWRRYGGSDAQLPVETRDLTARYFPGALRSGKRAPTVAGDEAARAVFAQAQGEQAEPRA